MSTLQRRRKVKVEEEVSDDYDELLEVEKFMQLQNKELQNTKQ